MIDTDATIHFSKWRFWKYFLYIALILSLLLYFQIYKISEFSAIIVVTIIMVCIIFWWGLLLIWYWEKHITGEAIFERYSRKEFRIMKKSQRGIIFLIIFGGIIPIFLITLPYILFKEISYELVFIYSIVLIPLWSAVFEKKDT